MKPISKLRECGNICIEQSIQTAIPWTFCARAKRDGRAAERFLRKTLGDSHAQTPRVINVDKNAAYPPAVDELKADEQLPETTELRQVNYLNNIVELSAPIPWRD